MAKGRAPKLLEFQGKSQSISAWAKEFNIKLTTLYSRLNGLKWEIERALTEPVRSRTMAAA